MNWKLYAKCLRVILFLEDPKAIEDPSLVNNDIGGVQPADETIINVDYSAPVFLQQNGETKEVAPPKEQINNSRTVGSISVTETKATDNIAFAKEEGTKSDNGETALHNVAKKESLLDNKPLVLMFEECGAIIKELERIKPGFRSKDSQDLMDIVRERIIQAMCLSGGVPIDNETKFNILRHQCVDSLGANDGDIIVETIEPGISLGDRIIIKAKVRTK